MPNFVVLGCLEVGEKFSVGGWWVGGGISTPTLKSNQLKLMLSWVVTKISLMKFVVN